MFQSTDSLEVNLERAAGDVIDGEAIIINLVTGVYYSMQGIGGDIWSMLDGQRSADAMLQEIVAAYDVEADRAREDLHAVLRELFNEELIQVAANGGGVVAAPAAPATKKPYRQPRLQVFRDMQELLALDPPAPGMNQIAWRK
jgi:hypothetical protein